MEIIVTIFVGVLGAAATIIAAYIQISKNAHNNTKPPEVTMPPRPTPTTRPAQPAPARPAQAATVRPAQPINTPNSPQPQGPIAIPVIPEHLKGPVELVLIFLGDSNFEEFSRYSYSSIEVLLDGERVGRGRGDKGFRITSKTNTGIHDLVFRWEEYIEGKANRASREYQDQSHIRFVLTRSGNCIVRLIYKSNFNIEHFDPPEGGQILSQPVASTASTGCLALMAMVLTAWGSVVGCLLLWIYGY